GREVARRCEYHPDYQWLTGYEVVNHHTVSDFRVDHQEALDKLFAQLLAILSSEGLITLEQVVHDGTKVEAASESQRVALRQPAKTSTRRNSIPLTSRSRSRLPTCRTQYPCGNS